ncbi:helix-turn-helix domain-containing protein [Paenibacillus sp. MMS20-IR301]|uniref:AraC family transcriptional regulator n=1 Tax=Paenibacillus sp. MMS20-IR301 TaxID=2895946 RepID=UPI0028E1A0C9|nr:helix-turn-helix domain-containing protein [Paenibacillus sp. MMS20-IR301]WNS40712.1 helix-turn-helix domain-containing protein [Paenibacillus sp. MMS20-IR301]
MTALTEITYGNNAGTLSVSHRKALSHHMPVNHFHSTFEIFYLMAGKRSFFIKDRTVMIQEGDIIIISPNVLHRTTNAEMPKHERLIINIHEQHLASSHESYNELLQPLSGQEFMLIRCSLQERLSLADLAGRLLREIEEQRPGFELFTETLALQFLITCCRHMKEHRIELPQYLSPRHEQISQIVSYINSHYMYELSLNLLADKFYISPYYLSRFFKEATGFSFVEYVNSVRIKEAKLLLEQTSLQVSHIAAKVGFGSVTHFGRVFKLVTGQKPLFYRSGTSS